MGKNIFVTGATGYVGRNLVKTLTLRGHNISTLHGDITDPISLPRNINLIYHCAGVIKEKEKMEKVNVLGTKNIVETALASDCPLIHLSSAGVIGDTDKLVLDEDTVCNPRNDYEISKYKAEMIVKDSIKRGLRAHILRPSVIFGLGKKAQGDSFFELMKSMRNGRYKNIGKGICNIVHVDEVIKALVMLGERDIPYGSTYLLSNHIPYKDMDKIIKSVEPAVEKRTRVVPYFIAFAAAAAMTLGGFLAHKKNPLTFSRLRALTDERIYSQEKIENILCFRNSCRVEEYLKRTCLEYIRAGLLS